VRCMTAALAFMALWDSTRPCTVVLLVGMWVGSSLGCCGRICVFCCLLQWGFGYLVFLVAATQCSKVAAH
jgi:hypothetical protein